VRGFRWIAQATLALVAVPLWATSSLATVVYFPEPATLVLVGSGVIALDGAAWRHRRRHHR
jgi:PEP-CTERM motif